MVCELKAAELPRRGVALPPSTVPPAQRSVYLEALHRGLTCCAAFCLGRVTRDGAHGRLTCAAVDLYVFHASREEAARWEEVAGEAFGFQGAASAPVALV